MKTIFVVLFALLVHSVGWAAEPEYFSSYDPKKGFKPAQRNLTDVYLQLAGSLEAHGSPVPYLKHVAAEHTRIEALYRKKFGKDPTSFRPAYQTDAFLAKLESNWKFLAPDLDLEPFSREFGHMMRDAINGTRGTGTIIIEIFNDHQSRVYDMLAGKPVPPASFDTLRTVLVDRLELDQKTVNEGQYSGERRDAVRSAIILHGMTMKLFARLDAGLSPSDAEKVKGMLTGLIMNVGDMAESELKAGISEWSFRALAASN